jgi:NTP pyrophosphatase (non-canonical NTP hydrolase)
MKMISKDDIEAFMKMEEFYDFDEYQKKALAYAIYDRKYRVVYPSLGLASEAGEVADKVKKWIRDGTVDKAAISKELGDVLWYIAVLANDLGFPLSEVAKVNLDKLDKRQKNGTIKGSGDNR